MNLTRDRLRSIGWAAVLLTCFTFTVILTFKVNAVKSQVRLAERQILAVKQDKLLLETEFETRANQQQLRSLNEVEFGYQAPAAGQYLEGERQLANLGKPRGADAPDPVEFRHARIVTQAHSRARSNRAADNPDQNGALSPLLEPRAVASRPWDVLEYRTCISN